MKDVACWKKMGRTTKVMTVFYEVEADKNKNKQINEMERVSKGDCEIASVRVEKKILSDIK